MVATHMSHLQIQELLDENRDHDCPGVGEAHICVRIAAIADLPSRFGDFHVISFWNKRDNKEHAAFVHGDPTNAEDVPVRLHSECLTGDAIGSLRCDCRDQLEAALTAIGSMETGILLYMRQEGRGIGFTNKIRAYGLQDYGYDTVDANLALGFRDDEREYSTAAHMLHSLKVKSIRLMTNNPRKIADLTAHGINITGRIPLVIPPNPHNRFYLETKAARSGHLIDFSGKVHLQEQMDLPVVAGMTADQVEALEETMAQADEGTQEHSDLGGPRGGDHRCYGRAWQRGRA
jgi:GTP cyclohydrolase II